MQYIYTYMYIDNSLGENAITYLPTLKSQKKGQTGEICI